MSQFSPLAREHREAVTRFISKGTTVLGIVFPFVVLAEKEAPSLGEYAYIIALSVAAYFIILNVRSDRWRTLLWSSLFLISMPITTWLYKLVPGEILCGYLLITLMAQFSIHSKKKQIFALSCASVGFSFSVLYINTQTLPTYLSLPRRLLFTLMYALIIYIFLKIESLWRASLLKITEIDQREADTRIEVELLREHALLGVQIKTILHEIDNVVQAMMLAPKNPEDQIKVVNDSVTQIRRVKDIVMKPVTGKTTHDVDVGTILDNVNFIIKKYVLAQFIKWDTDIDREGTSCIIREKEGAMYCMLLNIAKNCCEALELKTGSPKRIKFSTKSDGHEVTFAISDNGPGITPAKLNALRRGVIESSKGVGRGIGLSFVHEVCVTLGYRFEIDSKVGEGSEFRIIAPCITQPVAS